MGFRVLLFAFILALNTTQAHVRPPPKGLHYIGVGYNLLEGNPEGGQLSNGGVDPGLLFTRKVFKLTWDTNKVTVDKKTSLPDQVSFAPRQSCVKTNKKEVVTGSKSYQEKLNVDVSANGRGLKALEEEIVFYSFFLSSFLILTTVPGLSWYRIQHLSLCISVIIKRKSNLTDPQ